MTSRTGHRREDGATIAMVVLIILILAALMLYVSTATMGSLFQAKRKQERTTGMAAADSGIESIRVALNANLMDESDGFDLTAADLTQLVADRGGRVLSNAETSGRWGMSPPLVLPSEQFTVQEETTRGYSYWQVYNLFEPRYANGRSSDLTVYVRAWATTKSTSGAGANMVTKPRIFRAEFRPGYFSDYQAVADGPFFKGDESLPWYINGPMHSNGYKGAEWFSGDTTGIDLGGVSLCSGRARLTTSQNAPIKALGNCQSFFNPSSQRARQVNLLGVEKTIRYMKERCDRPRGVVCITDGKAEPYEVTLSGAGISVDGRPIPMTPSMRPGGDATQAAVLLDGDVNLSGTLSGSGLVGRATIATWRDDPNAPAARVYIKPGGPVGSGNPARDTVGVISQGDIVLGIEASKQCGSSLNMAAIAQSGGVVAPPELLTNSAPPVDDVADYQCQMIALNGSFAMHNAIWINRHWKQGQDEKWAGYDELQLLYNDTMYVNPPPFFARTYPWAMTKVKDADARCLTGTEAGNPKCE